jgi:uncharacterized membrane protein YozB (DUF420 family)
MTVYDLPAVNATLNAIAACFLFAAWLAIKRWKSLPAHLTLMVCALICSAAFLACYVYYHYHAGSRPYEGEGWLRVVYFAVLITHVPLAAFMVPFILAAVWYAARRKFETHRKIVRYLWPVWMYVSVTGVIIYVMLYQL